MPTTPPNIGPSEHDRARRELLEQLNQHVSREGPFAALDLVFREVGYAQPQQHDGVRVEYTTPIFPTRIGEETEFRRSQRCSPIITRTLSGTAVTNGQGKGRVRLNDYLPCSALESSPQSLAWEFPTDEVVFTATAEASTPATLTTQIEAEEVEGQFWVDEAGYYSIAQRGSIVDVHVSSWDAAGNAAPSTPFHWICVARIVRRAEIAG